MVVEHRDYRIVKPEDMVQDPAYADPAPYRTTDEEQSALGVWRWPLIRHYRETILRKIKDADYVVDFGGAAGPLGYGSLVVDRIGEYRSLIEIPGRPDVIFTSHTLEHIVDLRLCLVMIFAKLRREGSLIVQVPSWRKEHLRAENWPYHCQTFCLSIDKEAPKQYTRLDTALMRCGFTITGGGDSGEDILLFADRP